MRKPFARAISWIALLLPIACIVLFFSAFAAFYIYSIVVSVLVIVMAAFGINRIAPKNSKSTEDILNRLLVSAGVIVSLIGLIIYFIALAVKIH